MCRGNGVFVKAVLENVVIKWKYIGTFEEYTESIRVKFMETICISHELSCYKEGDGQIMEV